MPKVIHMHSNTYSGLQKYSYPLNFSHILLRYSHKQIDFIGILCERPTLSGTQLWSTEKIILDFIYFFTNKNWKVWCAKVFSRSQYFVEPPFAAITAANLLRYVSTSFAHLETEIFAHSSLQNSSSSVRLDGERLWTAVFRSCHRFSIGFRSGLWLGHSNTICFVLNPSIVALALWLASLSCWKVNLRPSLKSYVDSNRFSSKISLYLAPSIFPSTLTIFPVPAEEKHPQSMMLLPPYLTVGMVCSGWCAVLVFRHT